MIALAFLNKSFQHVFQSMLSKILTISTYFKRALTHTRIRDCSKIAHCGYALQCFCGAKWFSSGFCRHRQRHWKANKTGCDRFSCNHINKHSHTHTHLVARAHTVVPCLILPLNAFFNIFNNIENGKFYTKNPKNCKKCRRTHIQIKTSHNFERFFVEWSV